MASKLPATMLVIFGGTGDLTSRKLVPALYHLFRNGFLPKDFWILALSRTPLSDDQFREHLREQISKTGVMKIDEDSWVKFCQMIHYLPLNVKSSEDFQKLSETAAKLTEGRSDVHTLFYLATLPTLFGEISDQLRGAGLISDANGEGPRTSLIVEKPFGEDLQSAKELNQVLRKNFKEQQILRIDHYLGKETVQNILTFRFANGIFEPLWNSKHISRIEMSVCESIGVGSRGGYFDRTGILKDVVQNHVLQMLSLLCIEPPSSLDDAASIRDEKVKVLKSIKRYSPVEVGRYVVRGQYSKGKINGAQVAGYLEEDGVAEDSLAETYVALRLKVHNWRWYGVPIYLRAGKRLPKRVTQITVTFKAPPSSYLSGALGKNMKRNRLSIQVQPDEGISLSINSKQPGLGMNVRPVVMDFSYDESFSESSPDAYERLLLDAFKGDRTLFTRDDEIEQAWDLLQPIFETWDSKKAPPLYTYPAGSWGPDESSAVLKRRHNWEDF